MQRILSVVAVLAMSTSTWADEVSQAYNMGYADACNHSGGNLVDNGDNYHCHPKRGGGGGTQSLVNANFVGNRT